MIYPSQHAVYLVGGSAPVALAVGVFRPDAWAVVLLWIALVVALLVVDALLAPSLRGELRLNLPATLQVGEHFDLDPAVERNGRPHRAEFAGEATPPLQPLPDSRTAFLAARRGPGRIGQVWARRRGPLGLAWKQLRRSVGHTVAILPDLRPVREQGMRQFLRSMTHGTRMRTESGDGSEFQALTDFRAGMERRSVDWKASARHLSLLAREYRTERDNSVVLAIDAGRAMSEPLDGVPRVDRAISAALLAAFVALKSGDRVRLFSFAARPQADSGTQAGARGFAAVQRAAAEVDYGADESNYTLSLVTLDQKLQRRSLVLLFTEFTDPTSAELLLAAAGRLLRRHRVLFVLFQDAELEGLVAARPASSDDVVRANVAHALLRERRIVIERLKRMGVETIEAGPNDLALTLAERYAALRERW